MFAAVPFSVVQEFTVYTNASSSEWGRNAGTAVNLVTKSGTNDWHGDFVGMGRPAFSQANIPLTTQARPMNTMAQGSGTISGPIVKDKTFFLASAAVQLIRTATRHYVAGDSGYGLHRRLRPVAGTVRLDQQIGQNNRLTMRGNFDRFSDTNPQDAVSGVNLPTAARVFTRNTYQAALTETATISPNLLNDVPLPVAAWDRPSRNSFR